MRTVQNPFFILCLGLFVLNQLLEINHFYSRFLSSYLDDLVCLPLVLTFILAVQRSYFNEQALIMPTRHIFFAVLAFTVCFELVLPLRSETYIADALDVLAYTLGAFGFQLFLNKPLTKTAVD